MWLLHGFVKKQQETPAADLDLARKRKKSKKHLAKKNNYDEKNKKITTGFVF